MTLNDVSNQDCSSVSHESVNLSSSTLSNDSIKLDDQSSITGQTANQPDELMNEDLSVQPIDNKDSNNDEQSMNEEQISIQETIDNVLERNDEKVNNRSPNSKKKEKDNHLESPKKRTKLTPKKEDHHSVTKVTTTKSSPSLIRQAKLQINDKTLKKLRSDADDLIFDYNDEDCSAVESHQNTHSDHQKFTNDHSHSSRLESNINLVPVVNNVLSRSIAAIFKNSTINKNGEFNSYSALGFTKGPRIKRVCRTFSDVYRYPRAVFPTTNHNNNNKSSTSTNNTTTTNSTKLTNKSSSTANASQGGKRKAKKLKQTKPSPSTSKSNSNSSFKDDSTECSLDSDDLEITEYIEKNLKKEMNSHPIASSGVQ